MAINANSKGWIKKYFTLIDKNYQDILKKFPGSILNAEELVYAFLQPTGFLYGHPIEFLLIDKTLIHKITTEEANKILLLEGLVLVDHFKSGEFDLKTLEHSLRRFIEFYEKTNIERAKKSWLDFSKLDDYGKLESILDQRVEIKSKLTKKLLTNYLYNGLLFSDLLLFQDYLNGEPVEDIKDKRSHILLDLVKIIAISAHIDGEVSDEEKGVFKLFLASANLDSDSEKIAKDFFKNPKSLNDINFNTPYYKSENNWLLKRYLLEIAILTIWSDEGINDVEKQFLQDLTDKLGLSDEDNDKSYIAIQSFVITNRENVLFLKGKNDVELLLSGATKRWTKILGRNKDKLALELNQSKELVRLIKKSTNNNLTEDEKEKVKTQMYDLAKTIPSLALFMLPGGAIILPLVLKIIPNLIPSAFQENVVDEEE